MTAVNSILVMEPSRFFSAHLRQKAQSLRLDMLEISSLRELKSLEPGQLQNCFAAITDFSLPDAPNGEHIDLLSQYQIPVFALTGQYGKHIRDHILSKDVVDYFYKSDQNSVQSIKYSLDQLRLLKGKKALIVNDSKMQTFIMRRMLAQLGMNIQCVANGEEALRAVAQDSGIFIILTDYILPGMDGVELIYQLRQKFSKRNLIIMAMTGTISDELFAQVFKAGANEVLSKPFKKEELNKRLFREVELLALKNRYRKLALQYKEVKTRL